jgi:hypothetical protein
MAAEDLASLFQLLIIAIEKVSSETSFSEKYLETF